MTRVLAVIDEARCIGCTLCIDACPVDAIVGAAKQMHTVLASWCTGCALCLPPCPVDCIDLVHHPVADASTEFLSLASEREKRRTARLERNKSEQIARMAKNLTATNETPVARKRRIVATAISLARARLKTIDKH